MMILITLYNVHHYIPETRWFNVWATELTVKEWVTIDMFW